MLTTAGFRYEFLYDDIEHSSGSIGQHVREHGNKQGCQQNDENGTKRLAPLAKLKKILYEFLLLQRSQ